MYTFHKFFFRFLQILVRPWFALTGRYRYKKYRPAYGVSLILTNHTTNWDFLYFGAALRGHTYFVGSEHIFRLGFLSKVIRFLVDPIARKKAASSGETVAEIKRRLAMGRNVCMMAEGNRSFTGQTGFISPATAELVKSSGAALITYRIHGGYFVSPRWSVKARKGPVWGEVAGQYSPEELARMTDKEVQAIIERDLFVDAFADQKEKMYRYKAKAPAETLETALFACPDCGCFACLRSHGDRLVCEQCGSTHIFTEYGFFTRPDGSAPAFETVFEWTEWQKTHLGAHLQKSLEEASIDDVEPGVIREDKGARLFLVHPLEGKILQCEGTLRLFTDRLEIEPGEVPADAPVAWDAYSFELHKVSRMAVILVNTILFTAGEDYYEIRLPERANALHYLIAYYDLNGKEYKR